MELFPTLTREQAGNLAFTYVQCGVTAADVKAVLADGELGDQYGRAIEALKAESYRAFTEIYLAQTCLIGVHDFNANIQSSATNLKDLISAVSGAAFVVFQPSPQELDSVAQDLLTQMMSSFQQALETGTQAGGRPDQDQPVTCQQFAELAS